MNINRILVIGYGSMGRRRIRLISKLLPKVEFICVDNNLVRQRQAAELEFKVCGTLEEGMAANPDIAFVCTSPGHHAEIILELIEAGIHVFTELSLTSNKYDEIERASREHDIIVFPSSTLIYKRQMEIFKEILQKQIKPITYSYHVGQYLPDWHPWESYKDFFAGKKNTNGVKEILAIQMPWLINVFGCIDDIQVMSQRCTELNIDFPDSLVISIKHSNGNIGVFVADIVARKPVTRLEIIGEDIQIFWDGHNDDLFKLNMETKELELIRAYETEEHMDGYSDNIAEEPYLDEIREFLAVLDGNPIKYSLKDDAYALEIIDRIYSVIY